MVGVRLMPLPLAVKNYGLGVCEVRLIHFVISNIMADAPFCAVWASAGASCRSLSDALSFRGDFGRAPAAVQAIVSRLLPVFVLVATFGFLAWRGLGLRDGGSWFCRRRHGKNAGGSWSPTSRVIAEL